MTLSLVLFLAAAGAAASPAAPAATASPATSVATSVAAADSDSPLAEQQQMFDEAMAHYKAGECDAAMPDLKTLVTTGFHGMESALALRDCYEQKYKTVDGAVAALQAEVKANPEDEVGHSNLGCFYLRQQKRDEAKSELIRALEINPHDLDARANLAFWYSAVGQSHTAINEYKNILKTDPDNKRSLTELCSLIAEQENDAKTAEPFCERAAAGQEGNEMIGVTLGIVRMRAGDLDGAEKAFKAVLAANPDAHTAQTFLGVAHLQRGDYDGAQKDFEAVLAKHPDDVDAHVNLARVFQAKKDFAGAAAQYRAAYHESGNGMLLGALVKVYLQRYYYLIVFVLLGAMGFLLWRYLDVKAPGAGGPNPAAVQR